MHNITPLQLGILMGAYVARECDWSIETETKDRQRKDLIDNGLIIPQNAINGYPYALTEKGMFYVEAILNVPFPVSVSNWVIPSKS